MYCGRFAPSPTGPLHFGSLVSATASFLDARRRAGRWLVRIEDVDEIRALPGAGDEILRELERLGLWWDGSVVWQSSRKAQYNEVLQKLRDSGKAFPCACSRRDILRHATKKAVNGEKASAIYPGTCREGIPAGRAARTVRMRGEGTFTVHDGIQGPYVQDLEKEVGDFVLMRGDGFHAYHLAVVADDHEQGVTTVVRGSDLLSSTPSQLLLYQTLHFPPPSYAHVPIAVDGGGHKLSKQCYAPSTNSRAAQVVIAQVLSFLGHEPPQEAQTVSALWAWAIENWDLARIPTVPARSAPNCATLQQGQ